MMEEEIEVLFEVGDSVNCHRYPIEFSFEIGPQFVLINGLEGRPIAHYRVDRVICVRLAKPSMRPDDYRIQSTAFLK